MDPKDYISITEFCQSHHVEYAFIHSLTEHGLLEVVIIEEGEYIDKEQLRDLEKMMRMHYELEINMPGIDAINNLLLKVSELQREVKTLRNRLRIYED